MVTGKNISTVFCAVEQLSELTLARLHHQRKARGESVTGLLSLDHFDGFFFGVGWLVVEWCTDDQNGRKKKFCVEMGKP
jgi:hypothetical protein